MSKIELPPLPEPTTWGGGRHGEWSVDGFTADQLRARDRQIVEVCAQVVAAAGPKEGPLKLVTDGFVAAIRNLIEESNNG